MAADALLSRCRLGWHRAALVAVSLALAVFTFARGIKVLHDYKAYDDRTMAEIVASPEQAVLREREFDGYSRFVKPMNFNSSHFFAHELVYRAYFGKKNVQFVTDSVYVRYHEGRLLDGAIELPVTCDRPDVVDTVWYFADQDYMVITLKVDSLPFTCQQATYIFAPNSTGLEPDEIEFRRSYGLATDRTSYGFYPLRYQGRLVLVFPLMDKSVGSVEFPIDHLEPATLVTFKPQFGAAGGVQ